MSIRNFATGIWSSIGGGRYYNAGLMDLAGSATRQTLTAKTAKMVEAGELSVQEASKKLPTYRNSLMDSISTNRNPLNKNVGIGALAGATAGIGYSYFGNDMGDYKKNIAAGILGGGLLGHMDKVFSGVLKSQKRLTKELEDFHIANTSIDDLEW